MNEPQWCEDCGEVGLQDRFQCASCEILLCVNCIYIVWVVRNNQDYAHIMCEECAEDNFEGPQ